MEKKSKSKLSKKTAIKATRPDKIKDLEKKIASLKKEVSILKRSAENMRSFSKESLALAESEERYRNLINHMTNSVALWEIINDENGKPYDIKYLEVNPAFETAFGVKRENVIGHTLSEVFPEMASDLDPDWIDNVAKVTLEGKPFTRIQTFEQFGKTYLTHTYFPATGQCAVIREDITEKVKAEEALKKSEERYRGLFETTISGHGVFEITFDESGTLKDARYIDVNPTWEVMMGRSRKEVVGKSVFEIFPDIDHSWLNRYIDVVKTGNPIEFEDHFKSANLFVRAIAYRPQPGQCAVEFIDISKSKNAEIALKENEEKFRSLFEHTPTGFALRRIIFDENGKAFDSIYLDVNSTFEKMLGVKKNDIVGKKTSELFPWISREWYDSYNDVIQTGIARHEVRYHQDLGKYFEVYYSSPGPGLLATNFIDITEQKKATEALHESEFRLEQAIKGGNLAFWDLNLVTGVNFRNDRWFEVLGYKPGEINPSLESADEIVHPDDIKELRKRMTAHIEGKTPSYEMEVRFRAKSGNWVWIHSRGQAVSRDSHGRALRLVGTHLDITERKKAEDALREGQQRLELALKGGNLGFWDLIISTGETIRSPRYYEILGFEPGEMDSTYPNTLQLIHPDDAPKAAEILAAHIDGKTEFYETEFRAKTKSGEWKWVTARGQAVSRDEHGKALRVVGTLADITERRKAEEALRESEERYRGLFENLNTAVSLFEPIMNKKGELVDLRYLAVNSMAEKSLGKKRPNIEGKLYSELFHPKERNPIFDVYEKVVKSGEAFKGELYSTALNGYYDMTIYRPAPNRLAALFSDISSQKKAENALKESENKFRSLFENMLTGMALFEITFNKKGKFQDARFLEINPAYEVVVGLKRGEVVGKSAREVFPGIEEEWLQAYARVAKTGEAIRAERFNRHVGKYFDLYIYKFAEGLVAANFIDITESNKALEALRESEEKFHSLFEHMTSGFVLYEMLYDANGNEYDARTIEINPSYEKMVGVRKEDVLGKSIFELFPFVSSERILSYSKVSRTGVPMHIEILNPAIGKIFDAYAYSPKPGFVAVVFVDITERKKAEDALRESEEKFRSAFENASIGRSLTLPDGRMIMLNSALAQMAGYSKEELTSANFASITHPDDVAKSMECVRCLVAGEQGTYQFEKRYIHKDGHIVFVTVSSILFRDSDGKPIYLISDIVDITERKKAQIALEESEQKFRSIFTGSIDGIALHKAIYDDEGNLINSEYIDVNPALARMLGKTTEEMVGQFSLGFLPETDESWAEPTAQVLKTGQPLKRDQYVKEVDRYFEISLFKSGPDQIAVIRRDVTDQKKSEIALRESEQRFRALFDNMTSSVALWEIMEDENGKPCDGKYLEVNPAFEELTGRSRQDIIGNTISQIFPENDQEWYDAVGKVAKGGNPIRFVQTINRTGRTYLTAAYSLAPGQCAVIREDITERIIAEDKLRLANVYNRSLLESSLDPLVTIGPDGKITDANIAAEHVTGHMREELIGTDFSDYFTEPDKAREGYQHVFREGYITDYPLEVKHVDGHITSVIYNASLYKDEAGNVIGIFAAARDVTERKKAEDRVNRLNRLYSVLSKINEAIVHIREVDDLYSESTKIMVNEGRLRMAWIGLINENTKLVEPVAIAGHDDGYMEKIKITAGNSILGKGPTGSSIREKMFSICSDIETDPRMGPWREEALKRGYRSSAAFPLIVESKVIGAFTLYADKLNYFDNEEIQLLASLANDISFAIESIAQEKRRSEAEEEIRTLNEELEQRVKDRTAQLEASNKELEAFSYSVSHDLRAPLRAIDGFSRIILEDYLEKLDDEGKRVLGVIRKNTQDMGRLIDDLLAFSRVGRQKITPSRIDFAALARIIFDDIMVTTPGRDIEFEIKDPPATWADSILIRQVLVNLLSNAVKFTKTRQKALIEFGGHVEENDNVYYIKDNGVGFDMQYANKLFGVFQRLHKYDEFEGTGVGLAIVQRIIHLHGGKIWAESKIDEGAIFYFSLPI